jgi:hypothetical protein
MSPFAFDAESGEIPIGQHDVEIVEVKAGCNNKGNPNLRVSFETSDGGQVVDWLVHVPSARWRWRQLWEATGLEFPIDSGEVDETDLIGRRVHIEVIEDTYQGVTRRKVGKEFSAPVGLDVPVVEAKDSFAAAAGIESDEEAPF